MVGLVAPELAIGGVAVISKMAADSAMKIIDGIATDSSSKVVKEISNDLAKDVGDAKKSSDPSAAVATDSAITVDAKAVAKVAGAGVTTVDVSQHATAITDTAKDETKVVAVTTAKAETATPVVASSEAKPVAADAAQGMPNSSVVHGNSVDQTSLAPTALGSSSRPVVAAAAAVAYNSTFMASTASSTAAPVTTPTMVPTPPATHQQEVTTTSTATLTTASIQELPSASHEAALSAASVADDSLAHLHQSIHSTFTFEIWATFLLILIRIGFYPRKSPAQRPCRTVPK